jgi:hypothetical protein
VEADGLASAGSVHAPASVHACGNSSLRDLLVALAGNDGGNSGGSGSSGGAPLAIVPCCHTVQAEKGISTSCTVGNGCGGCGSTGEGAGWDIVHQLPTVDSGDTTMPMTAT